MNSTDVKTAPAAAVAADKSPPDGITAEGAACVSRQLQYVAVPAPQPGKTLQLAEGVTWCRIPLPIDLDHINVWLLETAGGAVLVDTGMLASVAQDAWEDIEREVLSRQPLRAIFVTHIHPDHIGLCAWLQERHKVPVWMSQRTLDQARFMLGGAQASGASDAEKFFQANGLTDLSGVRSYFNGDRFARMTSGLPQVERVIEDGAVLKWGSRAWTALETNGHADGHLCLSDAANRLLISGDQVLPTISSNISLTWYNRDRNPLHSYLASLQRLRELPDDTLVLPSHGIPFRGLRHRIDDLLSRRQAQLQVLQRACAQPKTAAELLPVMYRRPLKGVHLMLAFAETLAYLEYLVHESRLERRAGSQDVIRYAA